jgi:Uncharacterized conserved protein
MLPLLKALLIIVCVVLLALIVKQINKARVLFADFNYWILFLICLLIFAIFPELADYLSVILGVQTPIIAVFLGVVFGLILLLLSASFRISILNRRFIQLTQKIALLESEFDMKYEKVQDEVQKTAELEILKRKENK